MKWNVSAKDYALIEKIVARAMDIFHYEQVPVDKLNLQMDITAVHLNGCRLRLKDLLEADQFNFLHDVTKISTHIDRETGQLRDYFMPRFAA